MTTTMEDSLTISMEDNLTALRAELKQWERTFAATNGGRKPTREDIKKDAVADARYREYGRLRRPEPPKEISRTPKKSSRQARGVLDERSANAVATTPRKTSKLALPSPVKEEQPTPAFIRSALGPTPQKDGHVLGIFDVLSTGTPTKPATDEVITATPSKKGNAESCPDFALSRTPQSSGKRYYLDAFAGTPLKRKRDDEDELGTPGSATKKLFATPSFLRRSFPLASIDEDAGEMLPPMPAPFRKRGLVRSLSSIIQGMKKQEEQQMDDEWDVLQELEAEERGETMPTRKPEVLVEDSQAPEMPLGPDRAQEGSEDDERDPRAALGPDGMPRKPWKKKGLKRQTKRIIMRPNLLKPKKAHELEQPEQSDEEAATEGTDGQRAENDKDDDLSGSEYGDKQRAPGEAANKTKAPSKTKPDKDEPVIKRAARKVSAQAHANFRKLKIKSKNAKPSGRGGRFGRR